MIRHKPYELLDVAVRMTGIVTQTTHGRVLTQWNPHVKHLTESVEFKVPETDVLDTFFIEVFHGLQLQCGVRVNNPAPGDVVSIR